MFFMTLTLVASIVIAGLGVWLVKVVVSRRPRTARKLLLAITGLYAEIALAALAFSLANI